MDHRDWIPCTPEDPGPEYEVYKKNPVPYLLIGIKGRLTVAYPQYKQQPDGSFTLRHWVSFHIKEGYMDSDAVIARMPITLPQDVHQILLNKPGAKTSLYVRLVTGQQDITTLW